MLRPNVSLIRSVPDRANKWCVVAPLCERRLPETQVNVLSSTLSAPVRRKAIPYRMAGIDVQKKKVAVVVSDVEVEEESI